MIPILPSSAYVGALSAPQARGISPIFRGKILIGEESLRCYIKPLPDVIRCGSVTFDNREPISEALGYTLAKTAKYPTPDTAGIIILNREQIPSPVLEQLALNDPNGPQSEYVSWFSQDMHYPSLKQHINLTEDTPGHLQKLYLERLATHLDSLDSTPSLVTFDEWTENSDRNLGNLLVSPNGALILIDHGRLFRYPTWKPGQLSTSVLPIRNVIRELLDGRIPHWSEKTPVAAARAMAYRSLASIWKAQGSMEARQLLLEFLDPAEVEQVLQFLEARLEPTQYNKAVGLLI